METCCKKCAVNRFPPQKHPRVYSTQPRWCSPWVIWQQKRKRSPRGNHTGRMRLVRALLAWHSILFYNDSKCRRGGFRDCLHPGLSAWVWILAPEASFLLWQTLRGSSDSLCSWIPATREGTWTEFPDTRHLKSEPVLQNSDFLAPPLLNKIKTLLKKL